MATFWETTTHLVNRVLSYSNVSFCNQLFLFMVRGQEFVSKCSLVPRHCLLRIQHQLQQSAS